MKFIAKGKNFFFSSNVGTHSPHILNMGTTISSLKFLIIPYRWHNLSLSFLFGSGFDTICNTTREVQTTPGLILQRSSQWHNSSPSFLSNVGSSHSPHLFSLNTSFIAYFGQWQARPPCHLMESCLQWVFFFFGMKLHVLSPLLANLEVNCLLINKLCHILEISYKQ